MTNDEKIAQAERARSIIEDPLVVGALDAIEKTYLSTWRTPNCTLDEREAAWRMMQTMDLFKAALTTYIASGKIAARDAAQAEARAKSRTSEP